MNTGPAITIPYTPQPGISGVAGIAGPVFIPIVAKNSNSTASTFSTVTVPEGSLWMHPGMGGKCAVLRFTAQQDGEYTFNGKMTSIDNVSPNSVRGYFFGPQGALSGPIALTSGGTGTSVTLPTTTVELTAGESVDFAMDEGTNIDPQGPFRYDSTGISMTVKFRELPPVAMSGDHYQCYRIVNAKALKPETITIADQFGKAEAVLGVPIQLCNPAVKVHNGKEYRVENRERHLVCYQIVKPTDPQRKRRVKVNNQFAPGNYEVVGRGPFCVPSSKKLLGEKEYQY
jgi:hypothetical protein